jgi:hypothetical protein
MIVGPFLAVVVIGAAVMAALFVLLVLFVPLALLFAPVVYSIRVVRQRFGHRTDIDWAQFDEDFQTYASMGWSAARSDELED